MAQRLIWSALGLEEAQGKLLTSAVRFETHLTVLKAVSLTGRMTPSHASEVERFSAEADRLLVRRNTVVHAGWVPGESLHLPEAFSFRRKEGAKRETFSASDIDAIADDINQLARRGLLLLLSLADQQPSSP